MPFLSTSDFSSEFNSNDSLIQNKKVVKSIKHNKTIKKPLKKLISPDQIANLVNNPQVSVSDDDDEETQWSNFLPPAPIPPKPEIMNSKKSNYKIEEFSDVNQRYASANTMTHLPDYPYGVDSEKMNNSNIENKLNYLIDLLEEKKEEKSDKVIEDMILYTFLGIFIIFVVDTFSKNSKYVREV